MADEEGKSPDPHELGKLLHIVEKLKQNLENFPEIGTPATMEWLEKFDQAFRDAAGSTEDLTLRLKGLQQQYEIASRNVTTASAALAGLDYQAENLITRLTGLRKASNATFIESFANAAKKSAKLTDKAGNTAGALSGITAALDKTYQSMTETLSVFNVGVGTFRKFVEGTVLLTVSIDSATSAFARATGTGARYKDTIQKVEASNRHLGVSADQAAAATSALHSGFTEFLLETPEMQTALAADVAEFETFGVAAGTTVKFLEQVTRTTGRTRIQAQALQKSIMGTAEAFGDNLNEVMEEAAAVMPKIAIHGRKMEQVLDDLYAASKRTGMGMAEIVSFAEQFDTFEAAAGAAGQLNAVLGQMGGGTLVDTMQILETTDPAKRMQLFADAVERSVGNYEELGYYQQRAIANAMGLSVEETRRILLQEEQTGKLNAALAKAGLGEEKIIELQREGRDLMQEMKILAMQFAASLQGPLKALKTIVGWLSGALAKLNKLGKFGGFLKLLVGLGATMGLAGGMRGAVGKVFGPNGSKRRPFHVTMTKLGAKTFFEGIKERFATLRTRVASAPVGAIGAAAAPWAAGATGLLAGGVMAKKAWDTIQAEKDVEKKKKRRKFALGGIGLGGAAGAALLGLTALSGPVGWGLAAALAGGGALAGAKLGGLAEGGIVTRPTISPIGEKGPEAVIPLNQQGRDQIGMTAVANLLKENNEKQDALLSALKDNTPVLIKSDLEAAGFVRGTRMVMG